MGSPHEAAFKANQTTMQRHAALMKMARGGRKGGAVPIPPHPPGAPGTEQSHNQLANMKQLQLRNATFDKNITGGRTKKRRSIKKRRTNKKRK